jgi:CopG family transcriptional regulator, nickel-responsive regulator
MSNLVRMSLSIEKALLARLEGVARAAGYTNRSEFVRGLVRERLVKEEWSKDGEAVGTITLVYDHHTRELNRKLTGLQHRHHKIILTTMHVHLDADICVEVLLAKGKASHIREIADLLRRQKGVLHAALTTSSVGRNLK